MKDNLPKGYSYQPLPNYLKLDKSKIHGMGLFAAEDLIKNHAMVWGPTHILLDDGELIRTPLGGLINHSKNPNVELFELFDTYPKWYYKTLRDISYGEELTLDYEKAICGFKNGGSNLELSKFTCHNTKQ